MNVRTGASGQRRKCMPPAYRPTCSLAHLLYWPDTYLQQLLALWFHLVEQILFQHTGWAVWEKASAEQQAKWYGVLCPWHVQADWLTAQAAGSPGSYGFNPAFATLTLSAACTHGSCMTCKALWSLQRTKRDNTRTHIIQFPRHTHLQLQGALLCPSS